MKYLLSIPSYFLVLVYAVLGANYFVPFITAPPMQGNPATFLGLLAETGFLTFVKVLEIVLAILLLVPKTRALALILIAPISLNILLFEVFIAKQPTMGVALVIMNTIAIYQHRKQYLPIVR